MATALTVLLLAELEVVSSSDEDEVECELRKSDVRDVCLLEARRIVSLLRSDTA